MKIATFEVRIRLSSVYEENSELFEARYKLMDVPGVLSVIQIGSVDRGGEVDRQQVNKQT